MMHVCPVCGRMHLIHQPEFWPYRRGSTMYCSDNCLFVDATRDLQLMHKAIHRRKEAKNMARMKKDGTPARKPGPKAQKRIETPEGESVTAVDIKTTSDLCTFHRAAESLYYREQQALILLILAANGFDRAQARIAAIEKGPMPRCGVFEVKDMATGPIAAVNRALQDYATDTLTGKYSTRFEAPQLI